MERIEYFTMNKAEWGDGPWRGEPDKIQWQDEATGFPCLIKRNSMGALCGYVGVPEGHPWFERGCDDVQAEVHGGLTYSDFCQPETKPEDIPHRICHVPAPGEPEHVWWLGFDCSHAWDLTPALDTLRASMRDPTDVYRDVPYVEEQIKSLALQAQEASNGTPEISSD